jgi:hypothetical protein
MKVLFLFLPWPWTIFDLHVGQDDGCWYSIVALPGKRCPGRRCSASGVSKSGSAAPSSPGDFTDAPVNDPHKSIMSERMRDRLTATGSTPPQMRRKRGRPKGSKNKVKRSDAVE